MIILLAILLVVFLIAPPWSIVVLLVAAVLEVFEIRFLVAWSKRIDRRTKRTTGEEAMIGATAEVVAPCAPRGTVRYAGELWEAESGLAADSGDEVQIDAVEGLLLRVTPTRSAGGSETHLRLAR